MCCGTDTNRYCCIPSSTLLLSSSSSPSTPYKSLYDIDTYTTHTSNKFISEKWFFFQFCTIATFLAIALLIFVIIYLCLTTICYTKRQKKISIVQVPLPSSSPLIIEPKRPISKRVSTISNASSDVKSRYTDVSMVINTPLNLYPTTNSRNSTASSSSSSYYIYPNELEYLCR